MTARQMLRRTLGLLTPSPISPALCTNPLLRRYVRLLTARRARYEVAKRAILADRSLTDAQINKRWARAQERYIHGEGRERAVLREYERKCELPALRAVARGRAASKRRS